MCRLCTTLVLAALMVGLLAAPASSGWATTVYEADSLYHHIRVVDDSGKRTLRFDNSMETTMSIANPYTGHFEYIDYFFQAFVLNPDIQNTLMLGLGGGSAPKLMQLYFPQVNVDVVEIDPVVYDVAKEYFYFKPSEKTLVTIQDARVFLRRTDKIFDLIIMDAYTSNKYGSYIPFHLATREFFEVVDSHLSDDGIFAFNIIGQVYGERKEVVAALYRTLSERFTNLYIFPAITSENVVIIASKNPKRLSKSEWSAAASSLIYSGAVGLYPQYTARASNLANIVPPNWERAQLLTDDYAPIDGLLK